MNGDRRAWFSGFKLFLDSFREFSLCLFVSCAEQALANIVQLSTETAGTCRNLPFIEASALECISTASPSSDSYQNHWLNCSRIQYVAIGSRLPVPLAAISCPLFIVHIHPVSSHSRVITREVGFIAKRYTSPPSAQSNQIGQSRSTH